MRAPRWRWAKFSGYNDDCSTHYRGIVLCSLSWQALLGGGGWGKTKRGEGSSPSPPNKAFQDRLTFLVQPHDFSYFRTQRDLENVQATEEVSRF